MRILLIFGTPFLTVSLGSGIKLSTRLTLFLAPSLSRLRNEAPHRMRHFGKRLLFRSAAETAAETQSARFDRPWPV